MARTLQSGKTINFSHDFLSEATGSVHDHYKTTGSLGEGSYGKVVKGTHKSTGQIHAIKAMDRTKISDKDRFQDEINIQMQLDHPNIVKLYEVFKDAQFVYLVMELCTGGELFDRIVAQTETHDGAAFGEKEAATYMKQILRAMVYLHSHHFVHRDIKPENFLLQHEGADAEIKVIDFGLAKKFVPGQSSPMKTKAGTPYYVAPQVLGGSYDEKCDIWSSGVILYILLCGYPPFYGDKDPDILRRVKRGTYDFPADDWGNISNADGAKDLINKMLTFNPADRPSASGCLQHPWFELVTASGSSVQADFGKKLRNFRSGSRLKKVALTLIAKQLPPKDIKELKDIFESMDDNDDGTLTVQEISDAMKKKNLDVPEDLRELIHKLDTDGSGSIDYTEFIAATLSRAQYISKQVLFGAFRVFDRDNDGFITKEELHDVLHSKKVDKSVASSMIAEVDTDGDGKLSFEEFCSMMETQKAGALEEE